MSASTIVQEAPSISTRSSSPRDVFSTSQFSDAVPSSSKGVVTPLPIRISNEAVHRLACLVEREQGKGYLYEEYTRAYIVRHESDGDQQAVGEEEEGHQELSSHDHGMECSQIRATTSTSVEVGPRSSKDTQGQIVPPLKKSWRDEICQWIYNVVENHQAPTLPWTVAAATMSYFDRFLAIAYGNEPSSDAVLLTALASLRIATKLYGPSNVIFGMSFFLWIGRDQFTEDQIEAMELCILTALKWAVHPPTSMDFVHCLLDVLPMTWSAPTLKTRLEKKACDLLQRKAVCCNNLVTIPASRVAFASILNALEEEELFKDGIQNEFISLFLNAVASTMFLSFDDGQVEEARYCLRDIATSMAFEYNL